MTPDTTTNVKAKTNWLQDMLQEMRSGKWSLDTPLWGLIRLGVLVLAVLIFMSLSYFFYRDSTMPGRGLRYLFVPVVVLIVVLYRAARYIQAVYGLKKFGQALGYLFSVFFGFDYPSLVVRDGEKQVDAKTDNLLETIGGPGYLVVQPGNVALVENLAGFPRVISRSGRSFINRLERVKDILSLEEREAKIEKMGATTKDGIPVEARDVRYRYRLFRGEMAPDEAESDAELSELDEAMLNMAYNRNVTVQGPVTWQFNVNGQIDTAITDFIAQHTVDYLTAPVTQGHDPRGELKGLLKAKLTRALKERGAELVWIDVGHFEIPNQQVSEQRANTWQTRWAGDANIMRAYGEAQHIASRELGRAEAQAEVLMSIMHALEDVGAQEDVHHQRKVMLARIAGILDAMREPPHETDQMMLKG